MTAKSCIAVLVLGWMGCTRAESKPVAPPSASGEQNPQKTDDAKTTNVIAPIQPAPQADTATKDWTKAFATCNPGQSFEGCIAALRAGGVATKPGNINNQFTKTSYVNLSPPFSMIYLVSNDSKGGWRITKIEVHAYLTKGKARQAVVDWMKAHLGGAVAVESSGECGPDWGGPSWGQKDGLAEVEFAVATQSSLTGGARQKLGKIRRSRSERRSPRVLRAASRAG